MARASRSESDEEPPEPPTGSVRVELDLPHELLRPSSVPVVRQIEAWLHEQEIVEQESLLVRVGELLDELGSQGYSRVDHWEIEPGGWLPLPEASHAGRYEPVAHLLRALKSPAWAPLASARSFAVRLSSGDGRRADARVRHRHREREHSVSVVLWGPPPEPELRRTVAALRSRLAPLRVRVSR
jgi:hypothetical protein